MVGVGVGLVVEVSTIKNISPFESVKYKLPSLSSPKLAMLKGVEASNVFCQVVPSRFKP